MGGGGGGREGESVTEAEWGGERAAGERVGGREGAEEEKDSFVLLSSVCVPSLTLAQILESATYSLLIEEQREDGEGRGRTHTHTHRLTHTPRGGH